MEMNRREFLKGGLATLGFLALPGGLWAAPAGFKPKKKPNLVFGILSDTHLMVEWDGKSLYRSMKLDYVRNAFKLFKQRNIDAFVHLGDASHRGCVREWEFHKELFEEVFGKSGGPEKIIVVGNHELYGNEGHCREVYRDPAVWAANAICADLPRHYERTWGEPYAEVMHKEIKGYHFFFRHWNANEGQGAGEKPFADYILSKSGECSLGGTKPFFVLSHRRHHYHFFQSLKDYPNAIGFLGHWHISNADWKTIIYDWHTFGGFFPNIQVAACRYDGQNELDTFERMLKNDAGHGTTKYLSRQAMVVNVYDDFVVFERHEVGEGGKLGPDWVLPLGEFNPHPFSRGELAKAIGTPEFPKKAKLVVECCQCENVAKSNANNQLGIGAGNGNNSTMATLTIKIPLADGNPDSRAYAYDVVVMGDDPKNRLFKSAYFEGCNLGIGHEPGKGVTTVEIPTSELPVGKKLTVAVRPVSSLGTKGKTIGTTWRA